MCWHVSAPEKVPTPGKVPTRAGTSRCRHVPTSVILIIWTFLFANWDVLACVSTWKSADTWEGADTCRHVYVPTRADTCRHVPTSLILIIWTFLFGCWYVLTCVSTWKGANTWECADTCRHVKVPTRAEIPDINHMDFFICKLGCAGMCQHLKKCRHLGRCQHVPARLGADTCRHPSY